MLIRVTNVDEKVKTRKLSREQVFRLSDQIRLKDSRQDIAAVHPLSANHQDHAEAARMGRVLNLLPRIRLFRVVRLRSDQSRSSRSIR